MNNIYLVGMMGAGKSVTGKILAERLGCRAIETDRFITEASGQTIPDIFKNSGEQAFRDMESEVLADVAQWDSVVVSTGGGIVKRAENIQLMHKTGHMIYLKATPENLWKRIYNEPNRPLLNVDDPFTRIQELLKERSEFYKQADISIVTDEKTPEDIAAEIERYVSDKRKNQ